MGTTCGGAVGLNDLEEFGLFEADEKSVSRQMPRTEPNVVKNPGLEVRARTNGTYR